MILFVSLRRRIHAWRRPLTAARDITTVSLNGMCAGHFTLAVVTDRISLICRPRNKYPCERRQPATSSDRVGYFISASRRHITCWFVSEAPAALRLDLCGKHWVRVCLIIHLVFTETMMQQFDKLWELQRKVFRGTTALTPAHRTVRGKI